MKKLSVTLILFLNVQYIWACSSCNREFTQEDKIAFTLASLLLLFLVATAGYVVFKIYKKYSLDENKH